MNIILNKLIITSVFLLLISNTHAEVPLIDDDSQYLATALKLQTAFFVQSNSWFGNSKEHIGYHSDSWWEGYIEPEVKGHLKFSADSQLYYDLSYIYAQTVGDDPSGYDHKNPGDGRLEQAHIGWRSGNMFSGAKNLFDVSVGNQDYKSGHAFLLWTAGGSGGKNGGFWLGGRHAFQDSAVIRLNTQAVAGQAFRLRTQPLAGFAKDIRGLNLEYKKNKSYKLGFTYLKVFQKNNSSLDGADIYDFRLDLNEFTPLPGFSMLAEYVLEDNGDDLDSYGWYSSFSWQFKNTDYWKPEFTYRYAALQGDDPDTKANERFNKLRRGFDDWNAWYQGEIISEYDLTNSNLNTHMLKLQAKPNAEITLNLFYLNFRIDEPDTFRGGISSSHYADEIDFITDWKVTKSFHISTVIALAVPGDGAEEHTGGNDNWLLGMLYGSYKF